MKKKITFREWAALLAFGAAGMAAYYLIMGIAALSRDALIVKSFGRRPRKNRFSP